MDYDINMILPLQKENCKKNSWEEVEKRIGITFPEDYKEFIDSYGEGSINEFLWVLSPFCKNENLNSIKRFKVMQESYNSIKKEFPEDFLFEFYYGQNGLFPWGITDNGDELFWNYKDDTIDIIVYASRYTEYVTYAMSMEEFLCNLLKKDIICSIFPDDFILDSNYYVTV